MNLRSRKAQFEVIGLLVIVILISLGILYVVQFVVLKAPSNIKSEQVESQFATGFINSFLETTTESCHNQQVKALVHDCTNNHPSLRVQCVYKSEFIDSCEYLNVTAFKILNKTLIKNNRAFAFTIYDDNSIFVNISQNFHRCAMAQRIESKASPLKVDNKEIELQLQICN